MVLLLTTSMSKPVTETIRTGRGKTLCRLKMSSGSKIMTTGIMATRARAPWHMKGYVSGTEKKVMYGQMYNICGKWRVATWFDLSPEMISKVEAEYMLDTLG